MYGFVALALLVTVCSATTVPAYWGVHAEKQTSFLPGEAAMASTAFTVFRTFFNWTTIEYAKGQYDFSGEKEILDSCISYNFFKKL